MGSPMTTSVYPLKTMDINYNKRIQSYVPKLRKNRRIESRWGSQYHRAVQDAVFGKHCLPYMPTEPPASLSEEIVESGPLYVCKQCKDCFRFQSSFEDHIKRRSWILGLWCHNCFITVCTHVTETGSACLICIKKDSDKRAYLRKRGLSKNHKLGAVKVFYNQCQLFEHVKAHSLNTVDMGDLMLMPLPTNMSNSDWSPEFEIVCEALMERTFLSRLHIIDCLQLYDLEDDWWELVNGKSNHDLIKRIVNGYKGRQLFKTEESSIDRFMDFNFPDAVQNVNKSSLDTEFSDIKDNDINHQSANIISDKNMSENEDNPCMSTDIAFVDCGPTSRCFEPESISSVGYLSRKRATVITKATQDRISNYKKRITTFTDCNLFETDVTSENTTTAKASDNKNLISKQSSKSSIQQYIIAQPFLKETTENNISKPITKTGVTKTRDYLDQDLQTSTKQITNNSSKILTIQGPKSADITSIITQLPPHLISNKKLVFIEQDSYNKNVTTEKKSSKLVLDESDTDINVSSQKKMYDSINFKKQIGGKIVIKNGKKYLIKHSKNISKCPERISNTPIVSNASKTIKYSEVNFGLTPEYKTSTSTHCNKDKNISMEQGVSSYNDISFLTPSSSPSELTSESHVKKTTIIPKLRIVPLNLSSVCPAPPTQTKPLFETMVLVKEDGGIYMKIKMVDRISREGFFRRTCDTILKYRQDMIDEFYQLNSFELKERLDYLQHIREEVRKVLNFISDSALQEKLRSISLLQRILENCLDKCKRDLQDKKNDDIILNKWELEVSKTDPPCLLCNKLMKPKSYIAGFSKLSKDDNIYCSCYKNVCHKCQSYQGSLSRFIAHQNFHKKSKPYVCPDCNFEFASAKLLEVHTWTACFHILKKRVFACKICEIDGFRDMESVTKHFVIMHSSTMIACEFCHQVFPSYSACIQHYTKEHTSVLKQNPIRLVICKLNNIVVRCENYVPYLESYSGIRKLIWFKCPFCGLITLENKHVTTILNNHLRNKHLNSLSEIVSKEALTDIIGGEVLKADVNEISEDSIDTFTNVPFMDDTIVPKIVNTRTITSEIFERGSADAEDAWSVNSDEIIDICSQTTKTVDNMEKQKLSPKILNVTSMVDLNLSKSKETIRTLTETKEKLNSQDEKGKLLIHEDVKETGMELDDSKFKNKEETEKTKEPDKSNDKNNDPIALHVPESEKSPLRNTDDVRTNSLIELSKGISDSDSISKTSTNGRIKVIDIRKICKPNIEPLVTTELYDTQMKDENTSYMVSIPKPPPLARIPQHILESAKTNGPDDGSKNVAKSEKLYTRRMANKSKRRIAIHGPTNTQEGAVEYLCHLCDERIDTSWSVLRKHFYEKHSHEYTLMIITPQLLRMSLDFINGGYKQFISSKKRKSDSALFVSKRKRRWTPKKHTETKDTVAPAGLCVEQETAEDGEGNFKCKKCGQRCTDMSDLREHIAANHRLKGRYLICLECGENFVVAPSLQMHLKAFHGIEDPINFMSQNFSYASGVNGDSEAEGRTMVANQCHVCMAVFEDKAAVDKHLRVHGMAFLNRKRIEARNALKSPEKKDSTDDKRNVIKDNRQETVKRDKPAETILEKLNAMM